jgi:hypothetical protein
VVLDNERGSRFPNIFFIGAVVVVDPQSLPSFLASMTLRIIVSSSLSK